MSRILPEHPDLDHLKHQAKALLESLRRGEAEAAERFRSVGVEVVQQLSQAQHVLAREYGFPSWPKLKAHVESQVADPYQSLILAIKDDDATRVRATLVAHPELREVIDNGTDELGFGATPLIGAVQRRNRDVIDALLAAGADINVKSDWWAGGFSVLESADAELLPFLLERGAMLDACAAARFGLVDVLQRIVAADPEAVHQRGGDGKTPLHWAKDVATARVLVEHGADIDARDVDHESTAAQYLVREHQEVVRYLVERGCEADILMMSALGDVDRVRQILDADPRAIETTVNEVWFPMTDRRAGGSIYIWTLGQGKTPHLVAREFGHDDVLALLMERSPDAVKLAQACLLGDEPLFRQLMAGAPDLVASLSPEQQRQLVTAAINNNTAAVRLMLDAGWPVGIRGPHGGTALHWAAWHGNVAMAREILRHKPPLDARDDMHDGTPLGWAMHGSTSSWHRKHGDYAGVIGTLFQAGAKKDSPDEVQSGSEAALEAYRRGPAR
jgi:ankyrin repeat protein